MPQYIKDVLVGNLFGNGHLKSSQGFMFAQSTIHKEYILFVFAIYAGYTRAFVSKLSRYSLQ